jgi:hypothetical protein
MNRRKDKRMEQTSIHIERFVKKEEEGLYFIQPFEVPEGVEKIEISYEYPRYITEDREDNSTSRKEINIIDLGLNGAGGKYIGSSGSDRSHITISAGHSSQGFARANTDAGQWGIIIGAYKVQEGGVMVKYHITFHKKERRLLKGDTHMHTLGSDGTLSVEQIGQFGKKLGLDFVFVTDHNNYAHNFQNVEVDGISVLPGTEWTHYKGHSGFLGVKKPFESAFCVNSLQEVQEKIAEAKGNGALIVLNHPFCPNCGWKWGIEEVEYDAIEVWNGGLPTSTNLKCMEWWHNQLLLGKKIPITGGSDFHRFDVTRIIGMPTTCVYAMSNTLDDIITAIKNGNAYITMFTNGPDLYAEAEGKILGETAPKGSEVKLRLWNLKGKDIICLITDQGTEEIICEDGVYEIELTRRYEQARFCRIEVIRRLVPDLPQMKILFSNPIYFS